MQKINGRTITANQEVEKKLVLEVVEKLQKDNTFEVWIEALAEYLYDIIKETRTKLNKNTNTASLRWRGVIEAIIKKINETTDIYIDNPVLAVKIINSFLSKHKLYIHGIPGKPHFFVSIQEKGGNAEIEIEKRFREKMNNK